jgi:hypothetical protein
MPNHRPRRSSGYSGFDALARFVPKVTVKAFEKFGFAAQDIAGHWSDIVGADIARCASPERLRWPRTQSGRAAQDGGTLVIRVDGPRAVEIQHMAPRIIERINTYFGYRAVTGIKIIQGPLPKTEAIAPPGAKSLDSAPDPACENISDPALKAALTRLSRGVKDRAAKNCE